jgi:transposase
MQVPHILGVDLSKTFFDVALYRGAEHRFDNQSGGFMQLAKWMRAQKVFFKEALIVMEHTGRCSYRLEAFLHHQGIAFVKVAALQIQHCLGVVRGKTDRLDARRIARFGFEKQDQLQPVCLPEAALQSLQLLYSLRASLVKMRSASMRQQKDFVMAGEKSSGFILRTLKYSIKEHSAHIADVEKQITALIESNAVIKKNYELLKTEKAVGPVVAVAMIIKTQNFTKFSNGRKFACFSGTAPFEHRSGTSIKGRTRVSQLADKDMKSKLHQAAKCAIQHDPELKAYYLRKVAEGKAKMSVLNVISNKIIHRMFAIIKRQTPYEIRIPSIA